MTTLTTICIIMPALCLVGFMTLAGVRWAAKLWAPPECYKSVYRDRPLTLGQRVAMRLAGFREEDM